MKIEVAFTKSQPLPCNCILLLRTSYPQQFEDELCSTWYVCKILFCHKKKEKKLVTETPHREGMYKWMPVEIHAFNLGNAAISIISHVVSNTGEMHLVN